MRARFTRLHTVLVVAILATAATEPFTLQAQPPPRLFEESRSGKGPSEKPVRPHQSRKARGNVAALDAPAITINLFDNVEVIATRISANKPKPGRTIWHGRTDDGGIVTLTAVDGVMGGSVFWRGRTFEITADADGEYTIADLNTAAYPAEDVPRDVPDRPGDTTGSGTTSSDGSGGGTGIDVMVLWTPSARNAAGGTAAGIESVVLAAVANANLAYANSLVGAHLNLVYTGEVAWTESGIQSDLSALATNGDGVLDHVHALREQHGADIVTLLGSGYAGQGYCGIGYLMQTPSTSFGQWAFNVVDQTCAVGNLSYAHEVGHNQGLHHDPGNAGSTPSYPYAYGFQDPSGSFRTVLSYGGAPRVPHFSSPSILYNGFVTGTAGQDNARALSNNVAVVAAFRASAGGGSTPAPLPPQPCSYAVSPSVLDFTANGGSAAVSVTASEGCAWSSTGASWASVNGAGTGSGTAIVTASSTRGGSRNVTVTIASQSVLVRQSGATASATSSKGGGKKK